MQRVRIQILCAQTQPLPFEILALSASGFCYNAWTLGLRGSEGGKKLKCGSLVSQAISTGQEKAHRLSEAWIWGLEPIVQKQKENRHGSGVMTLLA